MYIDQIMVGINTAKATQFNLSHSLTDSQCHQIIKQLILNCVGTCYHNNTELIENEVATQTDITELDTWSTGP